MPDAADLTARLIRCPSVTPEEGGALVLLQEMLEEAGFDCHRVDRNGQHGVQLGLSRRR